MFWSGLTRLHGERRRADGRQRRADTCRVVTNLTNAAVAAWFGACRCTGNERKPGCAGAFKMKNPAAPAVKREEEEDWGKGGGGDP
jgi:hypothetical protein